MRVNPHNTICNTFKHDDLFNLQGLKMLKCFFVNEASELIKYFDSVNDYILCFVLFISHRSF